MKYFLLAVLFIPISVSACMPPVPGEVMIGRISSIITTASGVVNIDFSSYQFPFRDYKQENPTSWHWQSYSDTTYPTTIASGSLIIALSDSQDGRSPHNYSIYHITTLSCENNVIKLGKKYGTIMGWNRKGQGCGYKAHSLLDVFMEGDETVWMKKLRDTYPNCTTLFRKFPKENTTKDVIAPTLQDDIVVERVSPSWFDWILRKIDNFFRLF